MAREDVQLRERAAAPADLADLVRGLLPDGGTVATIGEDPLAGAGGLDVTVLDAAVLDDPPLGRRFDVVVAREPRDGEALAQLSRRYVVALTPNPACPWVWAARVQDGGAAAATDLDAALAAAGLRVLGHRTTGEGEARAVLQQLQGVEPATRDALLAVHDHVLPPAHRAASLAVLGSAAEADAPAGWGAPGPGASREAALTAALADALALAVGQQRRAGTAEAATARERSERHRVEEDVERRLRDLTARANRAAARPRPVAPPPATAEPAAAAGDPVEADAVREELERLRGEYATLVGSRAWRLGSAVTRAARRVTGRGA